LGTCCVSQGTSGWNGGGWAGGLGREPEIAPNASRLCWDPAVPPSDTTSWPVPNEKRVL